MKKLFLYAMLCLFLLTIGSAQAIGMQLKLDIGQALPGHSYGDLDDMTGLFDQFTFKAQTTTIQYGTIANGGPVVGDTFKDAGNLYTTDYQATSLIDTEGLNQLGGHEFTMSWDNITGYISAIDSSDPTSVKSTLIYDGGLINLYVDSSLDRNFGASVGAGDDSGFDNGTLVAKIEVVSGIGYTYFDTTDTNNPMIQGHTDFIGKVTWALDDFWYNELSEDLNDKYVSFGWLFAIADQNTDHIVTDYTVAAPGDEGQRNDVLYQILSDHDGSLELNAVPEEQPPGPCRMTGGNATVIPSTGLLGLPTWAYGFDKVSDEYWITTGGQIGAPSGDNPRGHWVHTHHGGAEGGFGFHSGTTSAPDGTEISTIACADTGWCVNARCAPYKQIFWTGVGNFAFQHFDYELFPAGAVILHKNKKFPGSLHYYEAMVGDFGENDRPTREEFLDDGNSEACNWFVKLQNAPSPGPYPGPPGPYDAPSAVFLDSEPNDKFMDKGGQTCDKCPDYYQIRIYAEQDPSAPGDIIYEFSGFLEHGNYQLHPATGDQCPDTMAPELQ